MFPTVKGLVGVFLNRWQSVSSYSGIYLLSIFGTNVMVLFQNANISQQARNYSTLQLFKAMIKNFIEVDIKICDRVHSFSKFP